MTGRGDRVKHRTSHPHPDRWNHSTHYFPLIAEQIRCESARILDVGCGEGSLCRYLASPGRTVTGLDYDASILPSSDEISYLRGSGEDLPWPDASFDAVTLVMTLHHLDRERALAEATRVLAPGGVLIILGMSRSSGWRDLPFEMRDVLAHRIHSRGKIAWEPATIKAEAVLTWADERARLRAALPGMTYRRLPMWRYLATWRRD